jgi:hypothetical protein
MKPPLSILQKLQQANRLITEILGEAPQLYDCPLDQALLVLVLAMKRARAGLRSCAELHPPSN